MEFGLGYQMYSAREDVEKDMLAVLRRLKTMGYDGVEFAGFFGHTADEIKAWLSETGLTAISSHVPYDMMQSDPDGTIAYHKALGIPYIVVPYLPEDRAPGGKLFAQTLAGIAAFGRKARENGITLLYHNHDFEFIELSGQFGLDFMYDAISACALQTELDTCWVRVAGQSPDGYIRKYAGRCPLIHLKDYVGHKQDGVEPYALLNENGKDDREVTEDGAFDFRPVGYGVQDVPALIRAGVESGAKWFIVEQDRSSKQTPLEDAALSAQTVLALR